MWLFRLICALAVAIPVAQAQSVDTPFDQEIRTLYVLDQSWETSGPAVAHLPAKTAPLPNAGEVPILGLPSIAIGNDGTVYAAGQSARLGASVLRFTDGQWTVHAWDGPMDTDPAENYVIYAAGDVSVEAGKLVAVSRTPRAGTPFPAVQATAHRVWLSDESFAHTFEAPETVLAVAAGADGAVAAGTTHGLYLRKPGGETIEALYPYDAPYSWAPTQAAAVAFDTRGRLWFGSEQGVGVLDGDAWTLYTGAEGLPYRHFTCATAGEDGVIWFGTERGAIRFDGEHWAYRAGERWLAHDRVNDIAVASDGTAWIATPEGISRIDRIDMTLEKKAAHYLEITEQYHVRMGYVTDRNLTRKGDITSAMEKITDNDGMYTGMYGAAMALRYAATGDPEAKRLAKRSFEACKRLVDIVPAWMHGFPARVLIPVNWHEPVNSQYSAEYNARRQQSDPLWKQITPRFVLSEDNRYMWKNDTSSDELAGHYFLFAVYYDLAAETEEEKSAVREVVAAVTDHLLRNGYNLVDHDGRPTRWGRFGPDFLYTEQGWSQRGLNSLMMLSFLATAEHITGDQKYADAAETLREKYFYHINTMTPVPTFPPDNVVPWDNNLALLCFYPLMQYENDPELLLLYRQGLEDHFLFISRQKNPLWSLLYAACAQRFDRLATDGHFEGAFPNSPRYADFYAARMQRWDYAPEDVLETLQRMPWELISWRMENAHRDDILLDPTPGQQENYGWSRVDNRALPIDERCHVRQDRDGFFLDYLEGGEGSGMSVHEGTLYLLPYYLGVHHGFLPALTAQ